MPSPIYVHIGDPQNVVVKYEDGGDPIKKAQLEALWKKFDRYDPNTGKTYKIWYRKTARPKGAQVDWHMPPASQAGRYRIEVFVPNLHATTTKALFTVAHNFRLVNGLPAYDDKPMMVDFSPLKDQWFSLGEFDLDPAINPWFGRVRLMDLSSENPLKEISFGPVRWVPLFSQPIVGLRYDSPVGTQSEREGLFSDTPPSWVGNWFDYNPFLDLYFLGHHTGADLNMYGGSAADKDAPVYSIADGVVIYAGVGTGSWGNIIVIEHPEGKVTMPDGTVSVQTVYSRYGHLTDQMYVKKGDPVQRGKHIGHIGLSKGATTGWHLHFDISHTATLGDRPSAWPDMAVINKINQLIKDKKTNTTEYRQAVATNKQQVLKDYIDPLKFIKANHG